jgi:hypothetical protein
MLLANVFLFSVHRPASEKGVKTWRFHDEIFCGFQSQQAPAQRSAASLVQALT